MQAHCKHTGGVAESGLMHRSRKPEDLAVPWVQIPPPSPTTGRHGDPTVNERTQGTVTGNAPCPHCDDDSQDECTKCGTLGLIQVEKSIDARWANRINECMKHVKVRDDICTPRYRETHGYPRSDTAHYIASVSDEDIDLAVFGIRYVGKPRANRTRGESGRRRRPARRGDEVEEHAENANCAPEKRNHDLKMSTDPARQKPGVIARWLLRGDARDARAASPAQVRGLP